jgi:hypothetical protein
LAAHLQFYQFHEAFWTIFAFGGSASGPVLTANGSLDLKQDIHISDSKSSYYIGLFPIIFKPILFPVRLREVRW